MSHLKPLILLAILSLSILASEIALTRIFSVIFWYHFGFLVLSTAMSGFGAGGLLIARYSNRLKKFSPDHVYITGIFLSGLSLVTTLMIITNNPFFIEGTGHSPETIILCTSLELLTVSAALLLPFTLMGATVLFILQQNADSIGRYYAVNLGGSGIGCITAILLLDRLGGINTILFLAALLQLSPALMMIKRIPGTALLGITAGLLSLIVIPFSDFGFPVKSPKGKPASMMHDETIRFSDWTSLSKLDIFTDETSNETGFGLWGLPAEYRLALPERLGVLIDYWAYTTILNHQDKPGYYDFLDALPMTSVYSMAKPDPEVLIIGAGGGLDIRNALNHNAGHIDAVEINPALFRAINTDFSDYSGRIYQTPGVSGHLAEGRNYIESTQKTYDIIQLSGVDTCSATQAGAFALSENFLYTGEAFSAYLNHLEPDGILTLTHWYIPTHKGFPRFSMRLFCLAVESLETDGIQEPQNNIIFLHSNRFAVIFIKKNAFTTKDLKTIERRAVMYGYEFLYRPDKTIFSAINFYSFIQANDRDTWYEDYPFNVTPPTDNSPFYFENRKLKNLFKTDDYIEGYTRFDGQTILILLLIEMAFISGILVYASRKLSCGKPDTSGWLYFVAVGMGFMLVEVSFTQQLVLFLGHPVYALSVVMFSILMVSGAGSLLSKRLSQRLPVPVLLVLTSLCLILLAFTGIPFIRNMTGVDSLTIRIVISFLFLSPVSFLMGCAFPEAIRRLSIRSDTSNLGIYWAWNSVASVSASVLAVIIAIESGFNAVMIVAALCYTVAAMLLPRVGRSFHC